MGHTQASYTEPLFLLHLLGGIKFAAGVAAADPDSTIDSNYQKVILDNHTSDPLQLAVAPDRKVFYIERGGLSCRMMYRERHPVRGSTISNQ